MAGGIPNPKTPSAQSEKPDNPKKNAKSQISKNKTRSPPHEWPENQARATTALPVFIHPFPSTHLINRCHAQPLS
jgi:hypothetical protein